MRGSSKSRKRYAVVLSAVLLVSISPMPIQTSSAAIVTLTSRLSGLIASAGSLSEVFDRYKLDYTLIVPFSAETTTITATFEGIGQSVTVGTQKVTSGIPSDSIILADASQEITIKSAAPGFVDNTYIIKIKRKEAATDSKIERLTFTESTTSSFSFESNTATYSITRQDGTKSTKVTASWSGFGETATATFGGVTYALTSGKTLESSIDLDSASVTVLIKGFAEAGTKTSTYTITITRAAAQQNSSKSQSPAPSISGGEGGAPAPILSIEFIDQILESSTIGVPYSDYLVARTLSNGIPDSKTVVYAHAQGSQVFPLGVILNEITGEVSGIFDESAELQILNLVFTASSPGYIPATTSLISHTVNPAFVIVPDVVPVADDPAVKNVETLTATDIPSDTSTVNVFVLPTNKLMMTALFPNNSSTLTSEQITAIKAMGKSMLKMNIKTVTVVGFTNAAPGAVNKKLAIARAKVLVDYLMLNKNKQNIVIKSVATANTKANQSASALIGMRKAEIWVVLKS